MTGNIILTREQVRRIDELAQTKYGLAGIVLMENAGSGAALLIDQRYGPQGEAFIACGTGNNGGDGLVVARHLHNAGWAVRVLIVGRVESMSQDCAANDRVIQAMRINRIVAEQEATLLGACDPIRSNTLVVDALWGTGFRGELRPPFRPLIERLNQTPKRAMVSIDVPSGLDCDTGQPGGAAILAHLTITFVAMKPGFLTEPGRHHAGQCCVVDIGVPRELIGSVAGC